MKYIQEVEFIKHHMREALQKYASHGVKNKIKKSEYDMVTEIDTSIEEYLIEQILMQYPSDNILSEETRSQQQIIHRTWVIDPIDGTCNMANGMPLYGMQCALIVDNEAVLSVVSLSNFGEEYYAIAGQGAYCNGVPITVHLDVPLNSSIVSFGDYTHNNPSNAKRQHVAIGELYSQVAKIRMFGAACMDFAFVASGKTDACVVITTNLWDILPGILLCKEAGCTITDLDGQLHAFGSSGVVVSSNDNLHGAILASLE